MTNLQRLLGIKWGIKTGRVNTVTRENKNW
jgi:hypothetical protein